MGAGTAEQMTRQHLAVVGSGKIAQTVLPLLAGCGWQVDALCATPRSAVAARQLCRDYDIPALCTDFGTLLRENASPTVYLAVPNHLHFALARQALEAGRNVILEKPLTAYTAQAQELFALAQAKGLFLFEAISTAYLPNFAKLQEWLPRVGTVKVVHCNYSQYSSRYDAFRAGQVLPAFDPACAGGALMDLNLYNLHWLVGLFGAPRGVAYHANIERGIDTSGLLTLDYNGFAAVAIGAKDCGAPCGCVIQGTEGWLAQSTPPNFCGEVLFHQNDGAEERFDRSPGSRLEPEFAAFARQIAQGDFAACRAMAQRSLTVAQLLTQARQSAGIVFPGDAGQAKQQE